MLTLSFLNDQSGFFSSYLRFKKVEAIGKLIDCTLRLTDPYDRLQIVYAIRDYYNTRTEVNEKENTNA